MPLHKFDMETYDKVMDVDVRGVFHVHEARHPAARRRRRRRDRELVVGGRAQCLRVGMPTSVYNAAKAAVVMLTKSASSEYGRKGVRVNCVCPGFIETEIMGASGGKNFPQMYEKASLGRAGSRTRWPRSPRSCARTAPRSCRGAIIPVDGGWSARLP